jgi:hypothetical protein
MQKNIVFKNVAFINMFAVLVGAYPCQSLKSSIGELRATRHLKGI